MKKLARRLGLCLFGVALAAVALEGALWWFAPIQGLGREWGGIERAARNGTFVADDELGYRPVLGAGPFDELGALRNEYARAKRASVERLLFLGDSVTARRQIVDALRRRYGEARFEFWVAGVEGFNTQQEVRYYERYAHAIDPDHVILTFHNNDFDVTPVAFAGGEGELWVYTPTREVDSLDPGLMRYSQLYRRYARSLLTAPVATDYESRSEPTRRSLERLRDRLDREGIRLSVVLLPILQPSSRWTEREKTSRRLSLALFEALDLRYFDLLEPLESALAEGVVVCETPGDHWHPSRLAAERFADFLWANGLLPVDADHRSAPLLEADVEQVSISSGGEQVLRLDAGPGYAHRRYLVLGSATGTEPATRLGDVALPLVDDAYYRFTFVHPNTWIEGSHGTLDRSGRAVAKIAVPEGVAAAVAGTVLHHAYVIFRPAPLTFYSGSNAVSLRLVP